MKLTRQVQSYYCVVHLIQGYRIKPEIAELLRNRFNITLKSNRNSTSLSPSDVFLNGTSMYFNTLANIVNRALVEKIDSLASRCPYTCNQPLADELVNLIQPYLTPLPVRVVNRDIVYIAWFVSNCDSHSGREQYVHRLRSQPNIHIDIYGACSSMLHSHIVSNQCRKGVPGCLEQTLKHYRFYLSFENSKCDTYITEKYWMQGIAGVTIPIVMGAKRDEYQRIGLPHSYIHVDDYATVEDLAGELVRLNRNDTDYNRYLQWTRLYDVRDDYSPMATYDFHNSLCFLGHYQRLHAMNNDNKQVQYLLERIRDIFNVGNIRLPNFHWQTARTKTIKLSEFYNPKVNCWDNEFPTIFTRIYNFLFTWWIWRF
jgi:hypothetical protein